MAGFVIVSREAWAKKFPGVPASRSVVRDWLFEKGEFLDNGIHGSIHRYIYTDEEFGEVTRSKPFLSPQDAIDAALSEHPDCNCTDDDFEETRSDAA